MILLLAAAVRHRADPACSSSATSKSLVYTTVDTAGIPIPACDDGLVRVAMADELWLGRLGPAKQKLHVYVPSDRSAQG